MLALIVLGSSVLCQANDEDEIIIPKIFSSPIDHVYIVVHKYPEVEKRNASLFLKDKVPNRQFVHMAWRIDSRFKKELLSILRSKATYDIGTDDCSLNLYSFLFVRDGKIIYTLTPNLTGRDLGLSPRRRYHPDLSMKGLSDLTFFIHFMLSVPPKTKTIELPKQ
jgi:hypothetical protein